MSDVKRSAAKCELEPDTYTLLATGLLVIASCLPVSQAHAQADPARITANAVDSAVQAAIQSARDRAYYLSRGAGAAGPAAGAAGPAAGISQLGGPPAYLRAAPTTSARTVDTAAWASGTYDHENTSIALPGAIT